MKIATHNAKFHADDVFAVATLLLKLGKENCEIVRTRDESLIANADYVVDVGQVYEPISRRFDHHQKDGAGVRKNGIPYASFGLVWKEYGPELCGSNEVADYIDRSIVQSIDSGDVGCDTYKMLVPDTQLFFAGDIVSLNYLTWKEDGDWDDNFSKSVEWAREVLSRSIKIAKDQQEAISIIKSVYDNSLDKKVITFDESHIFGRELVGGVLTEYPDPIYAVLLRPDHGNWQVLSIRKEKGSFATRKPLPEEWRAKSGQDLQKVTGINGAVFCHSSGFMCVAQTKEGALALAEKALNA